MYKKLTQMIGVSFIALFFTSCLDYPSGSDLTTEQLVSASSFDAHKDFSSFRTFAIPDYIVEVTDIEEEAAHLTNPEAKNALDQIVINLERAGYTKVDASAKPDLLVNVLWADIANITYAYPGWWWDYMDYWGFIWYYPPGYYPYYPVVVSAYEVGLMVVEIAENESDNNGKYPVIWTASVRGIKNIAKHSKEEVDSAIKDCFTQTPLSGNK